MLAWCKAAAPVESGSSLRPELAVGALTVMLQLSVLCLSSKWVPEPPCLLGLLLPGLGNICLCVALEKFLRYRRDISQL